MILPFEVLEAPEATLLSTIRGGSQITAVFYCSNNDILNKYLRYGCVHMQMAVYAGHYSGYYSGNYSKHF